MVSRQDPDAAVVTAEGVIQTPAEQLVRNSFAAQGLMETLGAELARVSDGEVHIPMPFSPKLSQQHGYIHAGAITSIVDSACGYAGLMRAPEGH